MNVEKRDRSSLSPEELRAIIAKAKEEDEDDCLMCGS